MTRCATPRRSAGTLVLLGALAFLPFLATPAAAQVPRQFPQSALRGVIQFDQPPYIRVNGYAAQLMPGARIHGLDNMNKLSGELVTGRFDVNYVLEQGQPGHIIEVWLLRPDEAAMQPWPVSPQQQQAWQFDAAAQTWTRP